MRTELERRYPRSEHVSWLYARWEAGDPWKPINRILLWQTLPLKDTTPDMFSALKGPHPRSSGHYCGGPGWCPVVDDETGEVLCLKPKMRWVDGPAMDWKISRQQWEIYREIGQYAEPFWVVQGPNGGHPKILFDWQKEALERETDGAMRDVPRMGELPYAPLDQRVFDRLADLDILRAWESKHFKAFTDRNGADVDQYDDDRKKALGPMWAKWVRETADEMYDGARSAWRDAAGEFRAGGSGMKEERKLADAMHELRMAALEAGE